MAGHINSSENLNWATPKSIVDATLNAFGGTIDLDPCSNPFSIVPATVKYQLPVNDGLRDPWNLKSITTRTYVNCPFGRTYMKADRSSAIGAKEYQRLKRIKEEKISDICNLDGADGAPFEVDKYTIKSSIFDWVSKGSSEFLNNQGEVIMLIPSSTDVGHWQKTIFPNALSACFLKGRLKFLMEDGTPGGPCPMAMSVVYFGTSFVDFNKAFAGLGRVVRLTP